MCSLASCGHVFSCCLLRKNTLEKTSKRNSVHQPTPPSSQKIGDVLTLFELKWQNTSCFHKVRPGWKSFGFRSLGVCGEGECAERLVHSVLRLGLCVPQRAEVCTQPPRRAQATSRWFCFGIGYCGHGGSCGMEASDYVLEEQVRC